MKLSDVIEQYDELNTQNEFVKISDLQGINNLKYFQGCQSNKNDIELNRYRICRNGMFSYNKATSRNGEKISIAYRDGVDCLVSPSYICFKIKDESVLMHEYLMMWFRRPTFDKYVRFHSWGSATEFFTFEDMGNVEIDIPSIEKQKEIVRIYNSFKNRIECLKKENTELELIAYSIFKNMIETEEYSIGTIADLGTFKRGKNITQEEMVFGDIKVISAGLEPSGMHNCWNVKGPAITISASGVNAGFVSLNFENIWAADCSYNNDSLHLYYLYECLKFIKDKIDVLKDGHTGQPHVYASDINLLEVPILNKKSLNSFNLIASKIFGKISNNCAQIEIIEKMINAFINNLE